LNFIELTKNLLKRFLVFGRLSMTIYKKHLSQETTQLHKLQYSHC